MQLQQSSSSYLVSWHKILDAMFMSIICYGYLRANDCKNQPILRNFYTEHLKLGSF